MPSTPAPSETITLAGGCFWCTEAVFNSVRGVSRVQSGYANGAVPDPSYEQVCSGRTGHAEAVRITFDPEEIDVREILEIFFATHDPTTPNRQGNDVGTQYRSGIYWSDPAHEQAARDVLRQLQQDAAFDSPIVTEVLPLTGFWPAEAEHGQYYARNPRQGYCAVVIAPKLDKFRKTFQRHLKAQG